VGRQQGREIKVGGGGVTANIGLYEGGREKGGGNTR